MNNEMKFPNNFEEFVSEYSFVDRDEVYTNGSELIQTFRVMQGYEHFVKQIRAEAINEYVTRFEEKNITDANAERLKPFIFEMHRLAEQMQKGAEE